MKSEGSDRGVMMGPLNVKVRLQFGPAAYVDVWCGKYVNEKVNSGIPRGVIKWYGSCYANAFVHR